MIPTAPARVTLPPSVLDAAEGHAPLTQWWIPVTLVGVSLALTVVLVLLRRRSPRPRRWVLVALVPAALLWLVTVLAGANALFAVVPDGAALRHRAESAIGIAVSFRTPGGGRVEEHTLPADVALSMPTSPVWVYTPPGYDDSGTTRYPVVLLVHGHPGGAPDWFTLGQAGSILDAMITSGLIPPLIAVAPDVNGGPIRDAECLDARNDGPRVETWLYQDLLPWVNATYPTSDASQHRIIAGFSAGGFCALDQGLRHQDMWGGIVALEGYGDPGREAARVLGYGDEAFDAVSPSVYIQTMDFSRRIPIYLNAAGRSDPVRVGALAEQLERRHQSVVFEVEPGQGHTWQLARLGLAKGLADIAHALEWS